MTVQELCNAERKQIAAYRRWETLREARNAAVREAAAQGMTHAQIAEATGLTRSRVGQIALSATP